MAYISATPRAEFNVNAGWFTSLVQSLRLRIERQRAYYRTLEKLSSMSDRELADINLSRVSIRDVAREAAERAH